MKSPRDRDKARQYYEANKDLYAAKARRWRYGDQIERLWAEQEGQVRQPYLPQATSASSASAASTSTTTSAAALAAATPQRVEMRYAC